MSAVARTAPTAGLSGRIVGWLALLPVAWLLYWGWSHRDSYYVNPEEGVGYLLGILGASLMLLLLLYPLRKQLRLMRHWGAVRHWFRMHMVFGIAGPLAILYHCNFHLGATNSNVALLSMLVVAGSGLVGRFLYARIHQGLYGRELTLDELRGHWEGVRSEMQDQGQSLAGVEDALRAYESPLRSPYRTVLGATLQWLQSGWRRRAIRRAARPQLRAAGVAADGLRVLLARRLQAAAAVYRFNLYERLFALWHLLHLPLFVMLVMTGIIHVVAVHVY